jgi:hypothetical protein
MTTPDYDDRDVEFTGVLAQPLKPGEDPSLKLPELYEALGVETDEAAVLVLARMVKPLKGFRPPAPPRRKRKTRGRPNLVTLISESKDVTHGFQWWPESSVAEKEEALFYRMETIIAEAKQCGSKMKLLDAAFRLINNDSPFNKSYVDVSIPREKREAFAKSVASLFTHRANRRKKHPPALEIASIRSRIDWWCALASKRRSSAQNGGSLAV